MPRPLLLLACGLLALAACSADTPPEVPPTTNPPTTTGPAQAPETLPGFLGTDAELGTLGRAVEAAGLRQDLEGEGPFTLFAPTDAAFEALPAGALDALLADPDRLARVLRFHVVPNRTVRADAEGGLGMGTLAGPELTLDSGPEGFTVSDGQPVPARVLRADLDVGNGVVHTLDRILLPPGEPLP